MGPKYLKTVRSGACQRFSAPNRFADQFGKLFESFFRLRLYHKSGLMTLDACRAQRAQRALEKSAIYSIILGLVHRSKLQMQ